MIDFEITDSNLKRRSFAEVIGTEPVVVTHAVDPLAELPYYQYLNALGQRVVLIISKDNPVLHIMMETHELDIETYTDPEQHLITYLKEQWSLDTDANSLVRQLRFQMLYANGNLVKYWKQPSSDQWQHFMDDRDAFKKFHSQFGSYGVKWLREQDKTRHQLWSAPSQHAYGLNLYTPSLNIELFLKLYHLMPNKELEDELKQYIK